MPRILLCHRARVLRPHISREDGGKLEHHENKQGRNALALQETSAGRHDRFDLV